MNPQPLLEYDVAYPDRLNQLLIFIKWLLVVPHIIVLSLLFFVLYFTTIIAWFAILITGRYPRSLWNFAMMTLRWVARVNAYTTLLRDDYPPFGDGDYPVRFEMAYPERLSRLLIFVKWLLIIPHIIVLEFLSLALGVVMFIAWFAILFTGRFPRGMFGFVVGVHRWSYRVLTYYCFLTDAYPPFSLEGSGMPTASMAPRPSF